MASRGLRVFGGAVVGFLLGGALTFAVGIAAGNLLNISQFEGAYAMQVAFFFTPVGAILGAIIGGIALGRRH